MAVDSQRGNHHINIVSPQEIGLLISAQSYRPEVTQAVSKIKQFPVWKSLQEISLNNISPGPHPVYKETGYPCIKTKNVLNIIADQEQKDYADVTGIKELRNVQVKSGDLLINLTGAGSIGRVSIYFGKDKPITNQHIARITISNTVDAAYVCSFLRTWWGERVIEQGIAGSTGQLNMVNLHVRSIPIPIITNDAQKYIGNKVRQAETLRAWAKRLEAGMDRFSSSNEIDNALKSNGKSVNRAKVQELTDRLDPKYYSFRACCVLDAVTAASKTLNIIVKAYSNGFEEREFVENGIPYITVSEVSSGRLKIESAPKISKFINIPEKAKINENCVLVIRTGSIGTAIKVDERDKEAVISSHLIKLEFENEGLAAAVAVFLNSSAGKVLLHKISYGAVQPQIGQDELIKLPIPEFILANASTILVLLKQYESSIRASGKLVKAAKQLVEALIENKLTEQELVNAQQALERGDNTLDRQILSRLTPNGIDDKAGAPLFPDLDQLYELLEKAEEPLEETP